MVTGHSTIAPNPQGHIHQEVDPDEIFVRAKAASYLAGLLPNLTIPLSQYCFAMALFAEGGTPTSFEIYTKELLGHLTPSQRAAARATLKRINSTISCHSLVAAELVGQMSALKQNSVRGFLLERMKKASLLGSKFQEVGLKYTFSAFQEMFRLNYDEVELTLLLFLKETVSHIDNFLNSENSIFQYASFNLVSNCLGISKAKVSAAMSGNLKTLDVYEEMFCGICLTRTFMSSLGNPSKDGITSKYFTVAQKPDLDSGVQNYISSEKTQHILGLLKSNSTNSSTHVLLWGIPGTGKSSFARWIAHESGIPAYEVVHSFDKDSSRLVALMAALNVGQGSDGALVIFDECDSSLNSEEAFLFSGSAQDKGILNYIMDRPGSRVIWISNRVDSVDPSTLRRFSYSVKFEKLGKVEREQAWEVVLKRHQASRMMPTGAVQNLAKDYAVSPGVIDTVVSKAVILAPEDPSRFNQAVKEGLDAHCVLTGKETRDRRMIGF